MAVIRVSGEKANKVITKLTKGKLPSPRVATLKKSIKSILMSL